MQLVKLAGIVGLPLVIIGCCAMSGDPRTLSDVKDLMARNAVLKNGISQRDAELKVAGDDLAKAISERDVALKDKGEIAQKLKIVNDQIDELKKSKVSIRFFNQPNFQNNKNYFTWSFTMEALLKGQQKFNDICGGIPWDNGDGGSNHENEIPRSVQTWIDIPSSVRTWVGK
jgi:hypothetical protein